MRAGLLKLGERGELVARQLPGGCRRGSVRTHLLGLRGTRDDRAHSGCRPKRADRELVKRMSRSSANAAHASTRPNRSSAISRPASRVPSGAGSPRRYFPVRARLRAGSTDVRDAELATERQYRIVVPALEQAVLVLQNREARGAGSRATRSASRAARTKFEQPIARTSSCTSCRTRRASPRSASPGRACGGNRGRRSPFAVARGIRRWPRGCTRQTRFPCPAPPELGCDDDLLASAGKHLAEKALAVTAVAVDLRRVEERHADVERGIDDPARPRDRRPPKLLQPRPIREARRPLSPS